MQHQEQPPHKNKLVVQQTPFYLNILFIIYILFAGFYLSYLIFILNWHFYWTPLLIIAETYSLLITFLFLLSSRVFAFPIWQKPLEGKTVDVLIPTLNEPEEIVAMTTIGALHIKGVNNVYILDDGNRDHIAKLAKDLGAVYLARPTHKHAKAGNMNYGLLHSNADFVICLDADHVAQANFIERTLGYFRDDRLAIVQTPQVFYNVTSFQHRKTQLKEFWHEQTMFYEAIQPGKNVYNAAFFCGSSAILRRSALDEVNGFATGTATEDIHTSLRLHAKGWRSLFVNERLAYGLAPEDVHEYHRQRVRWGAGSLGLLFRSCDSPLRAKGLTFMQRLCYLSSTLAYTQGLLKIFYYLLPILFIFSFTPSYHVSFLRFLLLYIPFFLFSLFTTSAFSRRTFHYFYTDQYNLINIFSNIESLKGVLKIQKKFGVSVKMKMKKEGQWIYMLVYAIASIMIFADLYGISSWFIIHKRTMSGLLNSFLFAQLFWNTFNLFFVCLLLRFLHLYNKIAINLHRFPISESVILPDSNKEIKLLAMSLSGATLISSEKPKINHFILPLSFIDESLKVNVTIQAAELQKPTHVKLIVTFDNLSTDEKVKMTCYFFYVLTAKLFQMPSQSKAKDKEQNVKPESVALQFNEIKNELLTA